MNEISEVDQLLLEREKVVQFVRVNLQKIKEQKPQYDKITEPEKENQIHHEEDYVPEILVNNQPLVVEEKPEQPIEYPDVYEVPEEIELPIEEPHEVQEQEPTENIEENNNSNDENLTNNNMLFI